jgi:acetyl-CoA synthetase
VPKPRRITKAFWGTRAKELLDWQTPFTQVLDESKAPFFKWFADGKLNVSYNCLDRQVKNGLATKLH